MALEQSRHEKANGLVGCKRRQAGSNWTLIHDMVAQAAVVGLLDCVVRPLCFNCTGNKTTGDEADQDREERSRVLHVGILSESVPYRRRSFKESP